jgi:hypothetical protein
MNVQDRIAALELELAELKKTVGKAPHVPPPQPVKDDDRPLISFPQSPAIELPAAEQCRQLMEAIWRKHPVLQPRYSMRWHDEEERELHAGFFTSARFISTLGRTSVNTTRYLSIFLDRSLPRLGAAC